MDIDTSTGISSNMPSTVPLLANEADRVAALRSYHILDTAEEQDFDDLTTLASVICQTPIALVSLVDEYRQWFKSHKGIDTTQTPKEHSFCAHAIAASDPIMIVGDAAKDERFFNNPLVTGEPSIAFYAGVPLVNKDGFALGSLCVLDSRIRQLTEKQISALLIIAKQVVDKLELRRKILELEATNQKLYYSENRFRSLVSQAPVAIAIYTGQQMVIEQANAHMLKILGRSDNIIGLPLLVARPELQGHPYLSILNDVFNSGIEHIGKAVKGPVLADGKITEGFYDIIYRALKDDAGRVTGIMVVATDVTEQLLAKISIEESNQRLQIALDAGTFGSYDADLATGAMLCNDQCKNNLGLPPDADLNFESLFDMMLPEYREMVSEKINDAVEKKTLYHAEYEVKWPDGSMHWISIYGKPRLDEAGNAIHMIGITQDITESKYYEQRKDDFLSIASHELKTPITSLKASLQLLNLIKNKAYSPMHVKLIEQSNKSMEKMSVLIDDLLNVNRMTEGQLRLDKTTFNIAELLINCCNHVRMVGKYELILQGDKELEINADEHRIDQVVVNFVNNAVKYAPDSEKIILSIEEDHGFAKISVADSGYGIPAEKLPFLFDRYYRGEHAGIQYSGLGLGLYICAEIVKRHGGKIGVNSEIGIGSTFWFTIPLSSTEVIIS